ncbi:hypothetical protein GCM10010123_24200 [Pilimelia anulata]|uniref:Single-stranded DNA-binding protein n=1 Tax=Pilimelia anulata TaxID=53371 RepID=A0A8J3F8L6_9ACTN|nr:single-stranded DNA-binding protein [Pilimelia anulata]GGJ93512.1 hypothetical protein GCM10010123_24200 [Pilimelia anulata]
MFDTYVTIRGNVLAAPTWRRTQRTQSLVANFKVASTARRFDRDTGAWVDGDSLRVRVNCWRRLAEGVAASVMVGDPVVVVGRLYTRDWTDTEGANRTTYEVEAVAVGHDLSRGRGRFTRHRPAPGTSEIVAPDQDERVRGEPAAAVAGPPVAPYPAGDDDWDDAPVPDESPTDALSEVRGGGFDTDGRGFGAVRGRPERDGGDGEPAGHDGGGGSVDPADGRPEWAAVPG